MIICLFCIAISEMCLRIRSDNLQNSLWIKQKQLLSWDVQVRELPDLTQLAEENNSHLSQPVPSTCFCWQPSSLPRAYTGHIYLQWSKTNQVQQCKKNRVIRMPSLVNKWKTTLYTSFILQHELEKNRKHLKSNDSLYTYIHM